jgi:histidyl-tRNA synthetase
MKNKVSIQPLKGFRDFLPEDWKLQQYIFDTWKRVCVSYGFDEYNGPILEDINIYNKSGGDIGTLGKELYSFSDRGDRNIALRPEMTPTVGRMVAAYGKNYSKPIKWFSIAQFFRAENPQKGRGREFFQLNADIFGDESVYSDFEVISLAIDILKAFKADENMFTVRINNRKFTDYYFTQHLGVADKNLVQSIVRVIDASPKKDRAWFEEAIASLSSDSSLVGKLDEYLAISAEKIASYKNESEGAAELTALFDMLKASNLDKYCVFDPYMARGFDYYTGMVFEVFDKNPNNNRSLFGGGRYDDLLDIFDQPKVPAVGFAPGDMTMRIFLEQWNLLSNKNVLGSTSYYIPVISEACRLNVLEVANKLRNEGLNSVRVGFKEESISKALSFANKNHIDKVVILGDDEYKKGIYKVKSMETGQEDSFDFA